MSVVEGAFLCVCVWSVCVRASEPGVNASDISVVRGV